MKAQRHRWRMIMRQCGGAACRSPTRYAGPQVPIWEATHSFRNMPITLETTANIREVHRSSIMGACRHSGERLQSASMASSFCRTSHLRPASRLKCWWSRKPRSRRRPGAEAFEIRSSSFVSRWSRLPARTGTPYCDSAGHPHLGLVGFSTGSAAVAAPRTSRTWR